MIVNLINILEDSLVHFGSNSFERRESYSKKYKEKPSEDAQIKIFMYENRKTNIIQNTSFLMSFKNKLQD
jgi:hypothetical protein